MKITRPHRTTHTYTQQLAGTPGEVFPLLCPVREREWVNGWDPRLVISASGFAERDCVFTVGEESAEAVWVVTDYEPLRRIEFLTVTPGETVARITITLDPDGMAATRAEVAYSWTALSERGRQLVTAFTAQHYERFMRRWEDELNHYLRTGAKLAPGSPP
jgi:hypothetical protein